MNSGDALYCSREQWRMQKIKEKKKGKSKSSDWQWKRQRPVMSCSSLFTCNMNSGECRRRRRKGRGREVVGGGNNRSQWLKGSCSPLMDDNPSFFFLCFCFSSSLSLQK